MRELPRAGTRSTPCRLVQRRGGELMMAAWNAGSRELVAFRLGSDGWWSEAGDAGEDVDVVKLACRENGGQAFVIAMCAAGK
jgi:hypothetical protein